MVGVIESSCKMQLISGFTKHKARVIICKDRNKRIHEKLSNIHHSADPGKVQAGCPLYSTLVDNLQGELC